MNTAIVMLGSNFESKNNIEIAKEKLSQYFEIETQSTQLITKSIKGNYKNDFLNEAIKLLSVDTASETILIFKNIEAEMGRTPQSKISGSIPIDIDLISWNGTIIHDDYNRFDFVKYCVNQLI